MHLLPEKFYQSIKIPLVEWEMALSWLSASPISNNETQRSNPRQSYFYTSATA